MTLNSVTTSNTLPGQAAVCHGPRALPMTAGQYQQIIVNHVSSHMHQHALLQVSATTCKVPWHLVRNTLRLMLEHAWRKLTLKHATDTSLSVAETVTEARCQVPALSCKFVPTNHLGMNYISLMLLSLNPRFPRRMIPPR